MEFFAIIEYRDAGDASDSGNNRSKRVERQVINVKNDGVNRRGSLKALGNESSSRKALFLVYTLSFSLLAPESTKLTQRALKSLNIPKDIGEWYRYEALALD